MQYTIIRSRRKTLSLQIGKDLLPLVRAPMRLSKREIDRFVADHADWIARQQQKRRQWQAAHPEPSPQEIAALRALAARTIPGRVSHYAAIMGLTPEGVRITGARTRFGSCSGKNALCFSLYLMRYPAQAVDYVVVHELAHIVHKNHGADFYALIASVLPDYKARRALLKG